MTRIMVTAEAPDGATDAHIDLTFSGDPLKVYGLLGATMSSALCRSVKDLKKVPGIGALEYETIVGSFCQVLYKLTLRELGVEAPAEADSDKQMTMDDIAALAARIVDIVAERKKPL